MRWDGLEFWAASVHSAVTSSVRNSAAASALCCEVLVCKGLQIRGSDWRRADVAPWHAKLLSQLAAAMMAGGDAGAALANMDEAVEVSRSTSTDQLVSPVLLACAAMHCV